MGLQGYLLIAVLLFGVGFYFHYSNLVENLDLAKEKITKLEVSLESEQTKNAELSRQQAENKQNITELNEKLSQERVKTQSVRRLFADHDFENLVQKKPGLITKLMQKATIKRFKSIEDGINEGN